MFALPELSKQASYAFCEAMADGSVADEMDGRYSDLRHAAGLCLVPTPNGLQQERTNVICGEYDYDQNAHVLRKGGVRFPSDDSINGVKVVFAEVARESQTASASKSKASFTRDEQGVQPGSDALSLRKRPRQPALVVQVSPMGRGGDCPLSGRPELGARHAAGARVLL